MVPAPVVRILMFTLLLFSFSYPVCAGEITHPVVAVVGEGGGFVDITIKAMPGSGQAYVGLQPYAGVSTQQSIKYAVDYARAASSSDTSRCDVLVRLGELPTGDYVEGPSAGAAIAVLTYALFENLSVREDTMVTGTLESGGIVGPVGGLYEKAKTSAKKGMKYFITPFNNIYEYITLETLEEEYDIRILQTNNIEDIIGFMIYNETISERELTVYESRISENTTAYYDPELEGFRDVAFRMIEFENYTLKNMPASFETLWINEYFNSSIEEQLDYIDLGYYFTAANDAFLNYIEISTINVVFRDDVDLRDKKREIVSCIDSIERPAVTENNFEWVVGSDLRKAWANDKLNSTDIQDSILIEEKYITYNLLMYSDAWCRVSQMLADAAGNAEGGGAVDESSWKELADEKLYEADSYQHSEDTASRMRIARKSYSQGLYGAAILDATYVIAMDSADFNLLLISDDEIESAVSSFSRERRTSLWGRVYQSQALFLMRQKESNPAAAYRLFIYAEELDRSIGEMREAMVVEYFVEEDALNGLPWDEIILIFILLSFVLLFILPKVAKRRSYGNSSKGRSGSGRAPQKKNRVRAEKKLSGAKQKR